MGAYAAKWGIRPEGVEDFRIEQGLEVERPSTLWVPVKRPPGEGSYEAPVGGDVVPVLEGTVSFP